MSNQVVNSREVNQPCVLTKFQDMEVKGQTTHGITATKAIIQTGHEGSINMNMK